MKKFLIAFFALSLAAAGQAQAARSDDMFGNAVWASANRPTTRSDSRRTTDMLPTLPTISSQGDMFQNAVAPVSVRDDMLVVRRQGAPISRLFSGWADR